MIQPSLRVRVAVILTVAVIASGTAGYMAIAGFSFVDALYQTVTTLSTVGFREVEPFGTAEKLFTVGLILSGVGVILYTLTLLVQEAVEADIGGRFYLRRQQMEIEQMEDHHIICGFGRVGQEVCREFQERGVPFVVIEQNPGQVELARGFRYHVIEGDASSELVLNRAGIGRARCLLAASDSDAGNTYITLTARSINPHCFVVVRVGYPQNAEKLRLAGADRVLSLYSMGGRRMVLAAMNPSAADFMDTLAAGRHGDLVLAEFEVEDGNELCGKRCAEFLGGGNATLLGIRRRDGTTMVGPKPDDELSAGDILIVLAEEEEIAKLRTGRAFA